MWVVFCVHYLECRSFGMFIYSVCEFLCPGMSSNGLTTRLAVMLARSLPLMFVRSLMFCSIVGSPNLILY
jgi:hypothetical protein